MYGPLLSEKQSEEIEGLQRRALRLIYGKKRSYRKNLNESGLEKLSTRREKALKKFAEINAKNPRFADRWFPKNEYDNEQMITRKREKYRITKSNYDR